MRVSAEQTQHPARILSIHRLSQHLAVKPHDGVGRDEQLVIGQRVALGLLEGDMLGNLFARKP